MYPARFRPDDNATTLVTFPDVPEAITFGEDRESAIENGREALLVALSMYVERGKPLPAPSLAKRGQVLISLPAIATAKLALRQAMIDQGLTKAELGHRLGVSRPQLNRMLDPTHLTRFEVLEAALAAVGKRASVIIQDAA